MATKATKKGTDQFLLGRIAVINKVLGKLEKEVEKALNKFVKQGEKSSHILKKNFDEILDKISSSDLYSKANEKKDELVQDIRKVADEVVAKVKNFDVRAAKTFLKEARANIDEMVVKIQSADFVEKAKDKVISTRDQVLSALNIPSQRAINDLQTKVTKLEKKIKTLSDKSEKAAA